MSASTEARNLDVFTWEFVIYYQRKSRPIGTISDLLPSGNKPICIDDNFLLALYLDNFGAAVWRTTMIDESCDIPGLGSYRLD
jgi:hypothetical protein